MEKESREYLENCLKEARGEMIRALCKCQYFRDKERHLKAIAEYKAAVEKMDALQDKLARF